MGNKIFAVGYAAWVFAFFVLDLYWNRYISAMIMAFLFPFAVYFLYKVWSKRG